MTELGMRHLMPWDAEWLFRITGDPATTRYMGLRRQEHVHEAAELLKTYASSPSNFYGIVPVNSPGELLGVLAAETMGHSATMLIMINQHDRRARGAGRLIGGDFVNGLFKNPDIWRVWSYVHVDNVPGQRVTERSGGMCEGIMRRYARFPNLSDEPQDCFLYSIVR